MTEEMIREKLKNILEVSATKISYTSKEHNIDAEIFLVDKRTLDTIKTLAKESEVHSTRKDTFFDFGKIINPDNVAYRYRFGVKHKPKTIFDRDKILKALPGEIARYRTSEKKKLKDVIAQRAIEDNPFSDEEIFNMENELEMKISIEEQNINRLIDNFDEYDVVITTFADYYYSPVLYYTQDNKKHYDTHIRSKVPNILWYEEDKEKAKNRSNSKLQKMVKEYDRYIGDVYMKRKEN